MDVYNMGAVQRKIEASSKRRRKLLPSSVKSLLLSTMVMSQTSHLIGKNVPGYGPPDSRCLPCSGLSGRTIAISSCSSVGGHRVYSQLKIGTQKYGSKEQLYVCKASSSGNRRNPDFSRQSKHGFSRSRNKQFEDRDNYDNFEESDLLSSKNGPLLSLSNTPRSQATAAPGPREKEIVELFRKVQAQLRERAARKEEKKIEASQSQGKESETVNSLLKLLRKHSIEQSKKSDSNNGSRDIVDQRVENGSFDGGKSTGFSDEESSLRNEAYEPNASSLSRPRSIFRRKSPVPRVKLQPIQCDEDSINSMSDESFHAMGKQEEHHAEPEPEDEPGFKAEPQLELEGESEPEPKPEPELEPEPHFSADVFDERLSQSSGINDADEDGEGEDLVDHGDLGALKLPELRALAKSHGVKGYSRMKKGELVELLSEKQVWST